MEYGQTEKKLAAPPLQPNPPAQRVGVDLVEAPAKFFQASITSGVVKVEYDWWVNSINGFLAGAFIALGGFFANMTAGGCGTMAKENPGAMRLIAGLVFPFGLAMIILTGAELVTSSFSTVGAAWFAGELKGRNLRTLVNLVHIYVMNFVGSLVVVGLAVGSGVLEIDPYTKGFSLFLSNVKIYQTFGQAFLRGIICNWLVSMAVLISMACQDAVSKYVALWLPISCFIATLADHCVANMFILFTGYFLGGDFTVGMIFTRNLIPVTLGNIVGSQIVSIGYCLRFKKCFWLKEE
eukprot:jgi/Tetstr1/425770/TSEL_001555.t1